MYDEDCKIGTVCSFARYEGGGMMAQSLCVDCNYVAGESPGYYPGFERLVNLIVRFGFIDNSPKEIVYTNSRMGDRWPMANGTQEYCENYLTDPALHAVRNPTHWNTHAGFVNVLCDCSAVDSHLNDTVEQRERLSEMPPCPREFGTVRDARRPGRARRVLPHYCQHQP